MQWSLRLGSWQSLGLPEGWSIGFTRKFQEEMKNALPLPEEHYTSRNFHSRKSFHIPRRMLMIRLFMLVNLILLSQRLAQEH